VIRVAIVTLIVSLAGGCSGEGDGGQGQDPGSAGVGDEAATQGGIAALGLVSVGADALVENVLLVSLDTLRADRLEPFGYGRPTSPNLAGIASRSVIFRQARSQAPQTAPSHASLFTSEYPGAHRIVNAHHSTTKVTVLPDGVTTLAELASAAGLETAAFVSGGNLTERMGMNRGFEVWDEALTEMGGRLDACVRWMLEPDRGPFLALLHTYQVHAPYLPPRELVPEFVDPAYDGPLRERTDFYLSMPPHEAWEAAVGPAYWDGLLEYTDADVGFLSDLYDAEVRFVDSELRRLFEYLHGAGLDRNTAVILLSDHGEEFREHGKYQHDQVFEEHLRVPLVVRLPPALEGQGMVGAVDLPVSLVDVAPTVADLLGIDHGRTGWEGRSLLPLLKDPSASGREWTERPTFSELVIEPGPKYHRAVVWQGWKYVHIWQSNIDHVWEQLYHLEQDPGEKSNLIASPGPEGQRALDALRVLLEEQTVRNAEKATRLGEGGTVDMDEDMLQLMIKLGYVELGDG
jgi:arylsulfatase A-like enzyme